MLVALEPFSSLLSRSVEAVAADLESYATLLRRWQTVQNLVSRETLEAIWDRHFVDSLQVLPLLEANDHAFLDLGSGGGFPALPLAIASKGSDRRFTLIEPNGRKVSFLRTVARDLKLNVVVLAARSDEVDPKSVAIPDVITSRALASLPQLCSWMEPFFAAESRAILHKGREHVEELRLAATQWRFDVVSTPSVTDPTSVLLTLSNLQTKTGL